MTKISTTSETPAPKTDRLEEVLSSTVNNMLAHIDAYQQWYLQRYATEDTSNGSNVDIMKYSSRELGQHSYDQPFTYGDMQQVFVYNVGGCSYDPTSSDTTPEPIPLSQTDPAYLPEPLEYLQRE